MEVPLEGNIQEDLRPDSEDASSSHGDSVQGSDHINLLTERSAVKRLHTDFQPDVCEDEPTLER